MYQFNIVTTVNCFLLIPFEKWSKGLKTSPNELDVGNQNVKKMGSKNTQISLFLNIKTPKNLNSFMRIPIILCTPQQKKN